MKAFLFQKSSLAKFPQLSGVYIFKNALGEILYVGKARNIRNRIRSYFRPSFGKTQSLITLAKTLTFIPVDNEIDALILEANLIKTYFPKFNVNFKDGKSYPFIKITTREEYPKIFVARKITSDGNFYFGPYPTGLDLRFVLRFIRRVFPFCTHTKPYQSCLYFHLGLCPGPEFAVGKIDYRKNIKKIILFLQGKKNLVLKKIDQEMAQCVNEENFEKAEKLQKQKEKIISFRSFRREPSDYILDSGALIKLRQEELTRLQEILHQEGVEVGKINTIEGYDISNISGKEASASLVKFVDGEPDKKGYRHFKIRTVSYPNDTAMLAETMKRRLQHRDWPLPDLFLIDGGFAQLNTVQNVLRQFKINLPVISLAKRLEHLCLPNGKEISLPFTSVALHLLQRIRDESHRFARRYHHLLRSKLLMEK